MPSHPFYEQVVLLYEQVARHCAKAKALKWWFDRHLRRVGPLRNAYIPLAGCTAYAGLAAAVIAVSSQNPWVRVTIQLSSGMTPRVAAPIVDMDRLRGFDRSDSSASVIGSRPAAVLSRRTAASSKSTVEFVASEELTCLAQNIYFEARSEPTEGKLAVAHVVMNRVASRRFPNTICGVVRQGGYAVRYRCQFSWWCDGKSERIVNRRAWQESLDLARRVYWNETDDPTGNALWYHADYVSPYWRSHFAEGPKIGRHIFYSVRAAAASTIQIASN